MGLAFGIVMTLMGLIATFGTRSWRVLVPFHNEAQPRQKPHFFMSVTQSLRHRSFRVLFISFSLFFLGVVMNSSLALHYLTYYVKVTASVALSTFQLAFYIGGLVGVFVWLWVSRIVEKHWLYFLAALATAALMLAALLLFGEGRFFGTGNVGPLLVAHGLTGFFGCILWFMPQSMIADIADEDEFATGQRCEGAFFGIFSFGQQLATSLSVLLAGMLLDWFAGLLPGEVHQSVLTVNRIAVLYSVLPAILVMASAAVILRYKLTRSRVLSIQAQLDRRRMA